MLCKTQHVSELSHRLCTLTGVTLGTWGAIETYRLLNLTLVEHTQLLPSQRTESVQRELRGEVAAATGGQRRGSQPSWQLAAASQVSSVQVTCSGSGARLPGMHSSSIVYYNVTVSKFLNFSVPQFPHL